MHHYIKLYNRNKFTLCNANGRYYFEYAVLLKTNRLIAFVETLVLYQYYSKEYMPKYVY